MAGSFNSNGLIYGDPAEIPDNDCKLPTKMEVIQHFIFLQSKFSSEKKNKLLALTARKVEDIWNYAKIPIVGERAMERKLSLLTGELVKFRKLKHSQKSEPKTIEDMNKSFSEIFNICACKCNLTSVCVSARCKYLKKCRHFYWTNKH